MTIDRIFIKLPQQHGEPSLLRARTPAGDAWKYFPRLFDRPSQSREHWYSPIWTVYHLALFYSQTTSVFISVDACILRGLGDFRPYLINRACAWRRFFASGTKPHLSYRANRYPCLPRLSVPYCNLGSPSGRFTCLLTTLNVFRWPNCVFPMTAVCISFLQAGRTQLSLSYWQFSSHLSFLIPTRTMEPFVMHHTGPMLPDCSWDK